MPEVFIQGGEGKLQAKYSPSGEEKPNIAIVLHPNPKHGGTMDSKVNYAAFKVMKDNGFSTLRINFRGVGKSDGAFTEGEGELNDASVSLDWLQKKNEDFKSCWIVGFSFGAWIGFQTLMRRPEVDGLILIAPPVNLYDFNFLSPCPIKTLIIKADQDEVVKKDNIKQFYESFKKQKNANVTLETISKSNHFFDNQLEPLMDTMSKYIKKIDLINFTQIYTFINTRSAFKSGRNL